METGDRKSTARAWHFKIMEMNFFRPNRIMFIFSAVPLYHYSLSSSLDLHEVENCRDLFFSERSCF